MNNFSNDIRKSFCLLRNKDILVYFSLKLLLFVSNIDSPFYVPIQIL